MIDSLLGNIHHAFVGKLIPCVINYPEIFVSLGDKPLLFGKLFSVVGAFSISSNDDSFIYLFPTHYDVAWGVNGVITE